MTTAALASAHCDNLDARLDNAIARAPHTGPAHVALEKAEALALANSGCPPEATGSSLTTATSVVSVVVNEPISDTATLVGDDPTGSITFAAFANGNCSGGGTPVPPPATVADSGSYSSGTYTPTGAGPHAFQASYSGDTFNAPVTSACEPFSVSQAQPVLTTSLPSMMVAPNSQLSDTAVLSGGFNPTGHIAFTLFTTRNDCLGPGTQVPPNSVVTVNGDGSYSSGNFAAPATPGNYSVDAVYNGDTNNASVTSLCEPFSVGQGGSGSG